MKKDPIIDNASSRDGERMIRNSTSPDEADLLFLTSSSDVGTVRNAGRRGASFAPEAVLAVVKKLAVHTEETWAAIEVADEKLERDSFERAQRESTTKMIEVFKGHGRVQKFIHLGGGHDHIYPLLKALHTSHKKIKVINIDAHLDTRTDLFFNSGTPFRQFARECAGEFELIQLGIHDFANAKSTMSDLSPAKEVVATYDDLKHMTANFTDNQKVFHRMLPFDAEALYVFSLDADALEASLMEGVSAVNHRGLPYSFVEDALDYCLKVLKVKHFGFYEYNPIYDNLSQKGARVLAGLIYKIMDD